MLVIILVLGLCVVLFLCNVLGDLWEGTIDNCNESVGNSILKLIGCIILFLCILGIGFLSISLSIP